MSYVLYADQYAVRTRNNCGGIAYGYYIHALLCYIQAEDKDNDGIADVKHLDGKQLLLRTDTQTTRVTDTNNDCIQT